MWFKRLLFAAALFCASPALAQVGVQFPAGTIWGNSTAAQRPGKVETVTAILDRALGSTRGAILERGASAWGIIAPGTLGLAFVSAGPGADPLYGIVGLNGGGCNAALTASNGGMLYSTATACAILNGTATARLPLLSGANTAPVWGAYTLPASVTSGGVACFTSTTVQGSSSLLTANAIVLGGGAGVCPSPMAALGTTTTVLHGNAGGAPTFGAVILTADVSGQLPFANGGCNGTSKATCFDNAAPTATRAGDIIYWNGSTWITLAGNNSGTNVLSENSSGVPSWIAAGAGTVTSIGITPGTSLSVSGSPVTTSGNITVNWRAPTFQFFVGSASATYTTPANVSAIKVTLCGASGGGSGSGTGTTGGTGGIAAAASTFSGGTLSCAATTAATASVAGVGATCTGAGAFIIAGKNGQDVFTGVAGNFMGATFGGTSGFFNLSGGRGGVFSGAGNSGSGGGAAGCIVQYISAPAATYSYALQSGGNGGTAGTSGNAGTAGDAARLLVEEY